MYHGLMTDVSRERIDNHLEETDLAAQLAESAELVERVTALAASRGLQLVRAAPAGRGRVVALFEVQISTTSAKWFNTKPYPNLIDLCRAVEDTLTHLIEGVDLNIYSSQLFEYLSGEMLPADGRSITLTITKVVEETIGSSRGESVKPIVSFRERDKKLILNKTNSRRIAKQLGPETDNWIGASLELVGEMVKVGKETVRAVRVKSVSLPAQPPAAAAGRRGGAGQAPPPPPAD